MKKLVSIFCGLCLAFAFQANAPAQTITNQPQSITINTSSTAAFTVGASNATSYQWQFNGSNLSDGVNITGSTNALLTLEDVNTNQAGSYTVVINGSVTSSPPAILTLVPGTIVTFTFTNLLPGAPGNNVQVQLFNHDKPVTVQNFLHYITAGAYTNMFIDRCNPDFVLQGGDYGASNQTAASPPLTGWFIPQQFTQNDAIEPPFPSGISNESHFGPLIHNRFGTIAMALSTGNSNSASSAFFFNLIDNSGNLDSQNGGFTVFGRILDANGTNMLQYFNTLAIGGGLVTNGQIVIDGGLVTDPVTTLAGSGLPVNYTGTSLPANSNLIFCAFGLTQPPGVTNPPAVSITFPAANVLLSNGFSLTVQGTAMDSNNIGLASVRCDLIPLAAADGTLPNGGVSMTNYVLGATNWSAGFGVVPAGMYELGVQVQDEAGNSNAEVFQPVVITAVFTNGNGTVTFTNGAFTGLNAVGYPFQAGSNYNLAASAGANQLFVDWSAGSKVVLAPEFLFSITNGLLWTATFISNGIPNGLAITYPAPDAVVSNVTFDITGTISNVPSPPVTVTCQIYSTTSLMAVGPPLTSHGAPDWSVIVNNLADGSYAVKAMAVDAASNSTAITQNFTVLAPVEIFSQPQSVTVNNASTATFTVGASNAIGYQWQFQGTNIAGATNSTLVLEDVMTNQEGNYGVIVSSSINSVTTAPPAVLTITNGTIIQFILSGLTNGNASNVVDVQLFDHDKPATVQNFLHYIRAGAYTNMFFDRCVTNFVLQGGDYGAADRTNTSSPMTGWDIATLFTAATNQIPPFPSQVDSEFNVGPLIHNRFGTIAMALSSGNSNSASSAFFINLADNSTNLDSQNGGFTVFGRILEGTNVLQYFNTLSNKNGLATNGVFFDEALQTTNLTVTNLPVNYSGTNAPANANLVFCDFTNLTTLPVDTNPPVVVITSPAPSSVLSNGNPVIKGTASDDVGLAVVICVLIPQAAADGTYPNGGVSITNYAGGTTNWSVTFTNANDAQELVPPGSYILSVQAQDGAGNLSPVASQPLTVTAIVIDGDGTVTFTSGAFTNLDAVGYPFQNETQYFLEATPGTNQVFESWVAGAQETFTSGVLITMSDGFVLIATFISNGIPNSLAFTYPAPNSIIGTNTFDITGTISNVLATPVTVTCYIYSTNTFDQAADSPLTNIGTTNWSVTVTNLPPDTYNVEVVGVDSLGNSTAITEIFTVAASATLGLNIVGPGTVSGVTNGETFLVGTTFQVTAIPNPGQLFYSWSNSAGISLSPVQTNTMTAGLKLTATFVTNNISNLIAFTFPAPNEILGPGTLFIDGTISNAPSTPVDVTCQIFSTTTSLAVSQPLKTLGRTDWKLALSGLGVGSYTILAVAVDQTGDSTMISENFTISSNVPLELNIIGPGTVAGVTNGEMIEVGSSFQVTATPNPGQLFYSWSSNGAAASLNPMQTYTMPNNGLALTAVFVTNNDSNMIAFTHPAANSVIGTNTIDISGTISNVTSVPVDVTCQIFSASNLLAVTQVLETNGSTNWAMALSGLGVGPYILVATALDAAGESTLISEDFSVAYAANLQVIIVGEGTVAPVTNGESLPIGTNFHVTASANAGQVFYTWNNGAQISTNATQTYTMASGLTLTATFIPSNTAKGISFTSPAANAILSTNTFLLRGRIASSMKTAQVTCQFFQTNGLGVGSPLTTSGANTWEIGVTNLPGGIYIVEAQATNAAGKSTVISEELFILPFAAVQGTYSGLFICTNSPVSPTNSGFLTFTLTPSGVMTGKLDFPAYASVPIYPLAFENIAFTYGFAQFSSTNFHGQSLLAAIYVDLNDGTDVAYGTISSKDWSSQLFCYRAVTGLSTNTTPATGKYILSLQPADQTNGLNTNGYASLSVARDGAIAVSGALPDNTTFSQSARVSKDGVWPLYAVPSGVKTNGMLLGWQVFSNSGSSSGQLFWHKARQTGSYYTNGVGVMSNMVVNSAGTNYSRPAAGGLYSIVFEGGTIAPPLTNTLKVGSSGQFVVTGGPADKLKMTLSANGVITGSLFNPNGNKTLRFSGAFISPAEGGSGFIPDVNGQTGSFSLHQ